MGFKLEADSIDPHHTSKVGRWDGQQRANIDGREKFVLFSSRSGAGLTGNFVGFIAESLHIVLLVTR